MRTLHTSDTGHWVAVAHVDKYDLDQVNYARAKTGLAEPKGADFKRLGIKPSDEITAVGNLLTTNGVNRLLSVFINAGGQTFQNTYARIGVGNGTTAAAAGDTDLSAAAGAANRYFQACDATYPSVSTNVLTALSTFGTGNGNFHWQEWGIDNGGGGTSASGTTVGPLLLNHKVVDLGTKTSAASWVFTVTVTIS